MFGKSLCRLLVVPAVALGLVGVASASVQRDTGSDLRTEVRAAGLLSFKAHPSTSANAGAGYAVVIRKKGSNGDWKLWGFANTPEEYRTITMRLMREGYEIKVGGP